MKPSMLRNAVWSFGAQAVRLATSLLLIALLDPAARGVQSLLLLLPTIVSSLAVLGMGSAAPVLLHAAGPAAIAEDRLRGNLVGLGLTVLLVLAAPLLLAAPAAARYLSGAYTVSSGDVLIGLLLLPALLLAEYLRALLVARRELREVALAQMAQAIVQLALALGLVLGLGLGPLGAVWAAVAGAWAGLFWTVRSVGGLRRLRPRLEREVLRPLLGLGLRGHAGNVVQTFNYRLDAFLVQGFLGQSAVGLYQTGVMLAELVWYVPNAISAALLPHIAATRDHAATPRLARATLALTFAAALALLVIAAPALALLRPAYAGAVGPMAILLVGVVALGLHKVLASDLSGRGFPQYPSLTSTLALVVTLVGDVVLIPWIGIVGAAAASTAAYLAQTAALLVIYRRVTGSTWGELLVPRAADFHGYRQRLGRWRGAER